MKMFKDDKGAITLYILMTIVFFFIAIVNVQIYFKNKEISLNQEYEQIKSSYESQNANEIYSQLTN